MKNTAIKKTKIYIGPMSKNIVDSVIDFTKAFPSTPVGLIASRRQVDYAGGYSNGWTTEQFAAYVRARDKNVLICRDHGGPGQGTIPDDGIMSFGADLTFLDIIHIDPFKVLNIEKGIDYTVKKLETYTNNGVKFEIGTEEAIACFTSDDLFKLVSRVDPENIAYVVVQAGTELLAGENTGVSDKVRFVEMLDVCKEFGMKTKEHNGDYQTPEVIREKFDLGLTAINIAPEVAHIETKIILDRLDNASKQIWFKALLKDGQWIKWFEEGFDSYSERDRVLLLCGHYTLQDFGYKLNLLNLDTIKEAVRRDVFKFLLERIYG